MKPPPKYLSGLSSRQIPYCSRVDSRCNSASIRIPSFTSSSLWRFLISSSRRRVISSSIQLYKRQIVSPSVRLSRFFRKPVFSSKLLTYYLTTNLGTPCIATMNTNLGTPCKLTMTTNLGTPCMLTYEHQPWDTLYAYL